MERFFCGSCKLKWEKEYDEIKYLNRIITNLKNENYEIDDYALNLSLPLILLKLEEIIRHEYNIDSQVLSTPKKDSHRPVKNIYETFLFTVKDIWKILVIDKLSAHLNVPFKTNSDFSINVSYVTESCNMTPLLKEVTHAIKDVPPYNANRGLDLAKLKTSVFFKRNPIFLAGRYNKYSRRLSQTPWLINNNPVQTNGLEPISLEEIIKNAVTTLILPHCPCASQAITFSASGREDVDVRCLGEGRPFCLEINDCRSSPHKIFTGPSDITDNILRQVETDVNAFRVIKIQPSTPSSYSSLNHRFKLSEGPNLTTADLMIDTSRLISIKDMQMVSKEDVKLFLKQGETTKSKSYKALCFTSTPLFSPFRDSDNLQENCNEYNKLFTEYFSKFAFQCTPKRDPNSQGLQDDHINGVCTNEDTKVDDQANKNGASFDLNIKVSDKNPLLIVYQKTPLRVLHRRSLLNRPKSLYQLDAQFIHPQYFILDLICQAGFYVKEFIHGDFGRTKPSLTSIFGQQIHILELDVTQIHLNWPPSLSS
ncbi:unnamed protein product [Gordionus sp. m RMFG-2023]